MTEQQLEYIARHANEDTNRLAMKQEPSLTRDEQLFALQQIAARQRLRDKLPTIVKEPRFVFPTRISTEQASSEITARLKAEILDHPQHPDHPQSMRISADLTGGLGIDTIFMGARSKRHHYVELNPEHSKAAEENLPLFMNNVVVHNTDAESFMKSTDEHFDFIYLDPARRNEGGSKVFMLEDCTPNILEMMPLLREKSERVIIKLSPMLDITQAIEKLRPTRIVVISVNDECKELVAICEGEGDCKIEAIEINKKGRFILDDLEGLDNLENLDDLEILEGLYGVPEEGMVLYEPYAAMMKAGLYREMAVKYGMKMVGAGSHLFFCEKQMPRSGTAGNSGERPFSGTEGNSGNAGNSGFPGRGFIITKIEHFNKNSFKGIRKANIATRNFPMSVAEIRQRFKVGDGGDLYVFCTTDNQGNKLMISCEKIS